jgi:hypothetical protein
MGSWGLYCKPLRIRHLWEIDRFRSKVTYSGLDKHTRLNKQTNTLAYCGVRALKTSNIFEVQAPDLL